MLRQLFGNMKDLQFNSSPFQLIRVMHFNLIDARYAHTHQMARANAASVVALFSDGGTTFADREPRFPIIQLKISCSSWSSFYVSAVVYYSYY